MTEPTKEEIEAAVCLPPCINWGTNQQWTCDLCKGRSHRISILTAAPPSEERIRRILTEELQRRWFYEFAHRVQHSKEQPNSVLEAAFAAMRRVATPLSSGANAVEGANDHNLNWQDTAERICGYLTMHENEKRDGSYVSIPSYLLQRLRSQIANLPSADADRDQIIEECAQVVEDLGDGPLTSKGTRAFVAAAIRAKKSPPPAQ